MPIHDWSRVEAGIFHHFHHSWIEEIQRALNAGLLPDDYYALAEQHAAGFGPDVLTLQGSRDGSGNGVPAEPAGNPMGRSGGLALAKPPLQATAETDMQFYRRKQKRVAVRHVSGDYIVAIIEVVSPGNKAGRAAIRSFVDKATELLDQRVHLLILDLHPPGKRDPHGIHALIWENVTGVDSEPQARPLTVVSYESGLSLRAYVRPVVVGDVLPDMPLFLEEQGCVSVPLEATYMAAWAAFPRRWKRVVDPSSS